MSHKVEDYAPRPSSDTDTSAEEAQPLHTSFMKERVEELLSLPRAIDSLCPPEAFLSKHLQSGWVHKRGLTEEEHKEILRIWRSMDGDTCYYDAWVRIVRSFLPSQPKG